MNKKKVIMSLLLITMLISLLLLMINLSIDNFLNDRQSTYVSIILLLSSVGTYFEKKERM
jgi:hypothetical protein